MVSFLVKLIVELVAWLFEPVSPRVQDGAGPGELEAALREKIGRDGW